MAAAIGEECRTVRVLPTAELLSNFNTLAERFGT